tara:strand:- start:1446 stop:2720 length:1275 start_codon:yes stop_codon:yes gene_type:complete
MSIPTSDLERGVMSCMLRDTSWPKAYTDASRFLQPKHFEDPNKAKAFELMATLTSAPDEMTLADKAGLDWGEVLDWSKATETPAQVVYYSEGVLKAWSRRQATSISHFLKDGIELGGDPKEVMASASKSISDALSNQGSSYTPVSEGIDDVLQHCFDMDEGKVEFLKSGFPDLDRILGGFKPGEMSVLAGRPSNGKTALALSMAALMAKAGKKVLFSSLEMSKGQLLKRLIHGEARIPIINNSNHYSTGDRQKLREVGEEVKKWPLKIDQASGITVPYISAKALSEKHRWGGLDCLIIDYLGIMDGEGTSTYERISAISRGLQLLAKRLECPVLVLCQQNRESENDKTPQMRHLRDSGSIEQDADQIIMLKRLEDGAFCPVETVDAYIVKNRNGGTGKVALTFSRSYARYDSHASDEKPKRYLT